MLHPNLLLAARANGLGAVITTWHIMLDSEFKAILGIPKRVKTRRSRSFRSAGRTAISGRLSVGRWLTQFTSIAGSPIVGAPRRLTVRAWPERAVRVGPASRRGSHRSRPNGCPDTGTAGAHHS
jgi:hypothetical protein